MQFPEHAKFDELQKEITTSYLSRDDLLANTFSWKPVSEFLRRLTLVPAKVTFSLNKCLITYTTTESHYSRRDKSECNKGIIGLRIRWQRTRFDVLMWKCNADINNSEKHTVSIFRAKFHITLLLRRPKSDNLR